MFAIGLGFHLLSYLLAVCTKALRDRGRWHARLRLRRMMPLAGCTGFALMLATIGIAGWKWLA